MKKITVVLIVFAFALHITLAGSAMPVERPSTLSAPAQMIYSGLRNYASAVDLIPYALSMEQAAACVEEVKRYDPILFARENIDVAEPEMVQNSGATIAGRTRLIYQVTEQAMQQQYQQMKQAVAAILGPTVARQTKAEQVLSVYEILQQAVRYAYLNDRPADGIEQGNDVSNAYGALVNGRAVCEGQAKAFQLLMEYLNIPSVMVVGTANGGAHAWNMIKLEQDWYHVDITNDNADESYDGTKKDYTHFLLSDVQIAADHSDWEVQGGETPHALSQAYQDMPRTADQQQNVADKWYYLDKERNVVRCAKTDGTKAVDFCNLPKETTSIGGLAIVNQLLLVGVAQSENIGIYKIDLSSGILDSTPIYSLPKGALNLCWISLQNSGTLRFYYTLNGQSQILDFAMDPAVVPTPTPTPIWTPAPTLESDIPTTNPDNNASSWLPYEGATYRLNYAVDAQKQTIILTGITGTATGQLLLPDKITLESGQTMKVTTIGDYAFNGCTGFTGSVVIPDSVTMIGKYAFAGLANSPMNFNETLTLGRELVSIGEAAFYQCPSFTGMLSLPAKVRTIGNQAFGGCAGFSGALTISDEVIELGSNAFSGCTGLLSVSFGSGLTAIGDWAFANCTGLSGTLVLPQGLKSVGHQAFYGCKGLTGDLIIPNEVEQIGYGAFQNCTGFSGSLILGEDLIQISDNAFKDCTGFKGGIIFGNKLETIGNYAFAGTNGFCGTLTLPNSLKSIGSWAFSGCSGFTGSLTIPDSVTKVDGAAFYNCRGFTDDLTLGKNVRSIGDIAFQGCVGLQGSLKLGQQLETIGRYTFYNCNFTGPLQFPDTLRDIGRGAFLQCTGLSGPLIMPDKLSKIEDYAFYGCGGLRGELVLGKTLTLVPAYAFSSCAGLTDIYLPAQLREIQPTAFEGDSAVRFHVVQGSVGHRYAQNARVPYDYNQAVNKNGERNENGNLYYYLENIVQTGWFIDLNEQVRYANPDGTLTAQFICVNGNFYYVNESGIKHQSGYLQASDGSLYYTNEYGIICFGWFVRGDGIICYADNATAQITERFVVADGIYYYVDTIGVKQQNGYFTTPAGTCYYANAFGAVQLGWFVRADSTVCYANAATGVVTPQFVQYNDNWYHVDEHGVLQRGYLRAENGALYYADLSNAIVKLGWFIRYDNVVCYAGPDGVVAQQFVSAGDNWYCTNAYGEKVTGYFSMNGKSYYANAYGVIKIGWFVRDDGQSCYAQPDGTIEACTAEYEGVQYLIAVDGTVSAILPQPQAQGVENESLSSELGLT